MIICPTCNNLIDFCDCYESQDSHNRIVSRRNPTIGSDDEEEPSKHNCKWIWHPTENDQQFVVKPKYNNSTNKNKLNTFNKPKVFRYRNPKSPDWDDFDQPLWPHVIYVNDNDILYSAEVVMAMDDGTVTYNIFYFYDPPTISDVQNAVATREPNATFSSWEGRKKNERVNNFWQGLHGSIVEGTPFNPKVPDPITPEEVPIPAQQPGYNNQLEDEVDGDDTIIADSEDIYENFPPILVPSAPTPESEQQFNPKYNFLPNKTIRFGVVSNNHKNIYYEQINLDAFAEVNINNDLVTTNVRFANNSHLEDVALYVIGVRPYTAPATVKYLFAVYNNSYTPLNGTSQSIFINDVEYPLQDAQSNIISVTFDIPEVGINYLSVRLGIKFAPISGVIINIIGVGWWDPNLTVTYVPTQWSGIYWEFEGQGEPYPNFDDDGTLIISSLHNKQFIFQYDYTVENDFIPFFLISGECRESNYNHFTEDGMDTITKGATWGLGTATPLFPFNGRGSGDDVVVDNNTYYTSLQFNPGNQCRLEGLLKWSI